MRILSLLSFTGSLLVCASAQAGDRTTTPKSSSPARSTYSVHRDRNGGVWQVEHVPWGRSTIGVMTNVQTGQVRNDWGQALGRWVPNGRGGKTFVERD